MPYLPRMAFAKSLAFTVVAAMCTAVAHAGSNIAHKSSHCPEFSGNFNISHHQLYPENSDWDSKRCLLYAGVNFNASLLVYDPYTTQQTLISFPGISNNEAYHISGVDYDAHTDSIYLSANSPTPFEGLGVSGPNKLIKLDATNLKVRFIADMAPFQQDVLNHIGKAVGGFQDMAEDNFGNSYFPASYGNAIAKVDPVGVVSNFYMTPAAQVNNSIQGYSGIVSAGTTLIVVDDVSSKFFTFDTTAHHASPKELELFKVPSNSTIFCDAIYLPPKYYDSILLCADDNPTGGAGSIVVYRSTDHWKSATYLGTVPNDSPLVVTSSPTATVQIADSIYINEEFFYDQGAGIFGIGNRTSFPFLDITAEVHALVTECRENISALQIKTI